MPSGNFNGKMPNGNFRWKCRMVWVPHVAAIHAGWGIAPARICVGSGPAAKIRQRDVEVIFTGMRGRCGSYQTNIRVGRWRTSRSWKTWKMTGNLCFTVPFTVPEIWQKFRLDWQGHRLAKIEIRLAMLARFQLAFNRYRKKVKFESKHVNHQES